MTNSVDETEHDIPTPRSGGGYTQEVYEKYRAAMSEPSPGVRQLRYELELSARVFEDYARQHADKAELATDDRERAERKRKSVRNSERAASCRRALAAYDAEASTHVR